MERLMANPMPLPFGLLELSVYTCHATSQTAILSIFSPPSVFDIEQ
jgi:hypothetical protein